MYTQAQIGNAGERIVSAALLSMNYRTNLDTRQAGSTDIEALGARVSLLVQVKTALQPAVPADLSRDEIRNITSRAKLGYQAWQAKVTVNADLQLVGKIEWTRLDV